MLKPVYSILSAALFVAVHGTVMADETNTEAGQMPSKSADPKNAEEIRACSRANLPDQSMAQNFKLQPVNRAGKSKDIGAVFFIQRMSNEETRATLQVRSPIDIEGVSYLWVDTEQDDRLHLYLPSVQRVRRVSGKNAANSMLGSDFSYEDIKYLQGVSAGGEVKKLADTKAAQRATYSLQVTPPKQDESAYERMIFYIDKTTCVPLKIEFFESGDTLRKRLTADPESLKKIGERWFATQLVMRDLLEKTYTRLHITNVQFDKNINGAIFNQRGFYLGAYLPNSVD